MSGFPVEYCCMTMRIKVDCNGCCRKLRRILLKMKGIETHMIEKQLCRVYVYGWFQPSDTAIKIRKKMKRRVEILEVQEFPSIGGHVEQVPEQTGQALQEQTAQVFPQFPAQVLPQYPGLVPPRHAGP